MNLSDLSASLAISVIGSRLTLGSVLVVAALAKGRNRASVEKLFLDLGAPPPLNKMLAIAIPAAELVVGALLLSNQYAIQASTVAAGMLLVFTAVIVANLLAGKRPSCNCFGELSDGTMSWWTVVRNIGLVALALLIIVSPSISAAQLISLVSAATGLSHLAVMWMLGCSGLVTVQSAFLAVLLRKHGRTQKRVAMLEGRQGHDRELLAAGGSSRSEESSGIAAPTFAIRSTDGHVVRLEDLLRKGRNVVLTFVSPHCQTCADLLADLKRWQHELSGQIHVLLVTRAPEDEDERNRYLGIRDVFYEDDRQVSRLYGIHGTPAAILIRRDGTLSRPASFGRAAIADVVIEASTLTDGPTGANVSRAGVSQARALSGQHG